MLEGLTPNNSIIRQFLFKTFNQHVNDSQLTAFYKLGSELNFPKLINRFVPQFMNDYVMSNFIEYKPEVNAHITPLENKPVENISIMGANWKGWKYSDDVYVLKVHGHSPDGVIFYFPKIHYLHASDEVSTIPVWPDTNVKNTIEAIKKYQMLVDKGAVKFLTDGHHPEIFNNKSNILVFLNGLLEMNNVFTKTISTLVSDSKEGLTIDEMYVNLQKNTPPLLQIFFKIQFPIFATFIKGYILNDLVNQNTPHTGEGLNRKYHALR